VIYFIAQHYAALHNIMISLAVALTLTLTLTLTLPIHCSTLQSVCYLYAMLLSLLWCAALRNITFHYITVTMAKGNSYSNPGHVALS